MTELPSTNIFFDMSGTTPRISRVIHDYGDGVALKRAYQYNAEYAKGPLLHVQVTKNGAEVIR